jgi:hypothetical protein
VIGDRPSHPIYRLIATVIVNTESAKAGLFQSAVQLLELRVFRLGFHEDGDVGVAAGRLYESQKLQIKGVNFLRAHVAQHKRGIVRG